MKKCTVFLENDGDFDDLFELVKAGINYNIESMHTPRVGTIAQCMLLPGGQMKIDAVLIPPRVADLVRKLFAEYHGEIVNFLSEETSTEPQLVS